MVNQMGKAEAVQFHLMWRANIDSHLTKPRLYRFIVM